MKATFIGSGATSHCLPASIASLAMLTGAIAATAGADATLFGITEADAKGSATLVTINRFTGATDPVLQVEIPPDFVPESMTYHSGFGQFVVILSAPDYHAPFALLRIDARTGANTVVDVTGFPAGEQKLHGIEYLGDERSLVVSFGASDIHLEDRLAEISIDGEALAFSPALGVGDIDYLAWPDANGDLILSDPNGHNGYPRLLSISDPFGTPHLALYADTAWQPAIGDPAVRPGTLEMYAINYDVEGGSLLELIDGEYVYRGPFGTAEQVVGIAFATMTCLGDFDLNGVVDAYDLTILLGAWGTVDGDLNEDGTTDSIDLAIVLGAWGPCPTS